MGSSAPTGTSQGRTGGTGGAVAARPAPCSASLQQGFSSFVSIFFLYLFILFPLFSIAPSEKGLLEELLQYSTLLHATPVIAAPFKAQH